MRDRHQWMWANALDMLAQAERMHRGMFRPAPAPARQASWEPPVDLLETDQEVILVAALPGVAVSQVDVTLDGPAIVIAGERPVPDALKVAAIHRLELPLGRFERRIPLPPGRYDQARRQMTDGCLVVSLRKIV